ncbi:LytTr DNA-binding domain-containing protein [Terribacillus halophilus]|uniref:LytTr DNA-binding domain-containing protein n=1 Tax=Terribacillus halophilus TaxID=361279 RepID=A0A1G6TC06_9BACI|nr:LytTR family DNA-binding domain-containing protein [Terribacillus halophilus]SDD26559.1 LytTr DNA-binding domain-containing protein [Terribacillus halophilus]
MKITIQEDDNCKETEVQITCRQANSRILELVRMLSVSSQERLSGERNGELHLLQPESLYYIESVDNTVFLYDKDAVYQSSLKLYQIEDANYSPDLIRVSKSVIVNLAKVEKLKPALGRKLTATLTNGEKLVISRQYVPQLKRKLGIGGRNKS